MLCFSSSLTIMKAIISSKALAKVKKQIQKKYSAEYLAWKEQLEFNRKYGQHVLDNDVAIDEI